MRLVAFLRGVNVGGHRTFRPSILAKKLARYDVVNVGAAGTFVVRNPGSRTAFREAMLKQLPFDTHLMLCDARDLLRAHDERPFGAAEAAPGVVRFVSVLSKRRSARQAFPLHLPSDGEWLVRVLAAKHPFVFGEYRRHMKTIGYLGRMDALFGGPVTTRNWNTISTIVELLREDERVG